MRTLLTIGVLIGIAGNSLAQEFTLYDAKREMRQVRDEVKKHVVFPSDRNPLDITVANIKELGPENAVLKSELKLLEHRAGLEQRAARAGQGRAEWSTHDVAGRLKEIEGEVQPEFIEFLPAYVAFAKAYHKDREILEQDKPFLAKVEEAYQQLNGIMNRQGPDYLLKSATMLYQDDPTGKIGAFRFVGSKGTVKIDGREAKRFELRTLDDCGILLIEGNAPKRNGFVLGEILGKQTYKTDDGTELKAILIEAH